MRGTISKTVRSWQERWERLLRPHYPRTVFSLESNRLTGLRLAERREKKRKRPILDRWAEAPLPPDAWRVSFTRPNLTEPGRVREAAAGVLRELGVEPGEPVSVLLPDAVARVSLLGFPELPLRRREILPLIRFRLQKTVPFRMEDAVLVYDFLDELPSGESRLLAVILHRAVLNQYEELFRGLGVAPGLIDLSSMNLLNLCRGEYGPELPEGSDWLLVNLTGESLTLLIARDRDIRFYRCKVRRPIGGGNGQSSEAALREIRSSLAYYRERLGGGGIDRCYLRATCDLTASFRRGLAEAAGVPAETMEPVQSLERNPERAEPDPVLSQRLVPLIGMGLGRRE